MKRVLLFQLICLWALSVTSQQDPVLLRIDGKAVLRSEFESAYQLNHSRQQGVGWKTAVEFVDPFVDIKLKVAAAQAAGIDTTRTFRDKLIEYRRQLAQSYLTDTITEATISHQLYNKILSNNRGEEVEVMHIFQPLPQTLSATRLRKAEARMDSIYRTLTTHPYPNFESFVREYSDDKQMFKVGRLQTTVEFENIAFSLQKGEISKPLFTPQGLHIVKLIDRKEAQTFEDVRESIERRLTRQQGVDHRTDALVQRLKAEYNYTLHEVGVEELLATGKTNRPLFALNGKEYTGDDFERFSIAYPRGIKTQLDAFVAKTLLDYEYTQLERKQPNFHLQIEAYKEAELVTDISNQEVEQRASTDEAGLSTYFKLHKSKYHWAQPRYRGIVLSCADKTVAKRARKLIKKLPESEWASTVRRTFNTPSEETVHVEQGLFAEGDNPRVDKLIFKKGDGGTSLSYPFTVVWGEKQKGPNSYKEVRATLVNDYRNFLDMLWIKRLRAVGKVEINQEVLKTVNNH